MHTLTLMECNIWGACADIINETSYSCLYKRPLNFLETARLCCTDTIYGAVIVSTNTTQTSWRQSCLYNYNPKFWRLHVCAFQTPFMEL